MAFIEQTASGAKPGWGARRACFRPGPMLLSVRPVGVVVYCLARMEANSSTRSSRTGPVVVTSARTIFPLNVNGAE